MRAGTIEPEDERATPDGIAGLRVLVVDDNAINREVAAAMLEERGCRVALAQEGSEAVAQASAAPFDLTLMDCQMPGLDGYAATENIRREEREDARPATLIVALTANVMPRDRERCLEAGMDDILLKPFSGDQLDAVLMLAVEHARDRGATSQPIAEPAADQSLQQTLAAGLAPEFDLFEAPPAAAHADSGEPILDPEQIEAILALRRPQLLEQLCGMLRERAPSALQTIDAALACGDLVTVRATAHELRSPAGTLGGRRLAALLGLCENAAAEQRLEAARSYGTQLAAAYASLDRALDALLARHAAVPTGT
jgi:CheY-like chemotaxis protein